MKFIQGLSAQSTRQRLRRASTICGMAALLLVVLGWSGLMLLLCNVVLPPWVVGAILCVFSIILDAASRKLRGISKDQHPAEDRVEMGGVQLLLITLAAAGSVLSFFGDVASSATYTLLSPGSQDGCQAVTRETSFLFAGGGQAYAVLPGGLGWRVGSWTADDGIRPIQDAQYTVSWSEYGGTLLIRGDNTNPVWPGLHDVSCF